VLTAKKSVETTKEAFSPRINPDGTVEDVVPFGISGVDASFLVGVEPTVPQMYAIQGAGGTRKTTFVLNIIANMCLSGKLPENHQILVDSLENGMSIERYLVTIRLIIATKILIYERWTDQKCLPIGVHPREYAWELFGLELPQAQDSMGLCLGPKGIIHGAELPLCAFTIDFVKACYRNRLTMTDRQLYAWETAGEIVSEFPITVFGVSEHPDNDEADRRSDTTTVIENAILRWGEFAEVYDSVQIVVDFMQEYFFPDTFNLYEKQLRAIPYLSQFVKDHRCTVWVISQESIGQGHQFDNTGQVSGSAGGNTLKNASHTNWRVGYKDTEDIYHMKLFRPVKSRRGMHPDLQLNIEPNSGAIFGKSQVVQR
jgi:hypothetical protein